MRHADGAADHGAEVSNRLLCSVNSLVMNEAEVGSVRRRCAAHFMVP